VFDQGALACGRKLGQKILGEPAVMERGKL